jgi:hypothetical protein
MAIILHHSMSLTADQLLTMANHYQTLATYGQAIPEVNVEDLPKSPAIPTVNVESLPKANNFPHIDPAIQAMLGVAPDDQLGPITQKALDAHRLNANMTKEQVWTSLQDTYRGMARQPLQHAKQRPIQHPHQIAQHPHHNRHPAPTQPPTAQRPTPTFANHEYAIIVEGKEKLDPKAKVRNRGKVIFPAEKSLDHQDHYPINNIDQARSALRYAGKQKSAPWYHGTVESMQKAVERAVYHAYPELKQNKKSSLEICDTLLAKYS